MSLRGDYNLAASDFSVEQDWNSYSAGEHALFRRLFERQSTLVPRFACPEWIEAIASLDAGSGIPRFDQVSKKLRAKTGWEIVAVPGLIPDEAFFTHLANRRFPVTVWLRKPAEFDYIVEPDVFHDFFGHVPLLFDPVYADHLHEYGKGGLKAMRLDAVKMLARLYWYTIEFGLIRTAAGIREHIGLDDVVELRGLAQPYRDREPAVGEVGEKRVVRDESRNGDDFPAGSSAQLH